MKTLALLRQFLLAIALLGAVVGGVVHANAPAHDSAECTVCLHNISSDIHGASASLPLSSFQACLSYSNRDYINPTTKRNYTSFRSRAPPQF